MTAHPKPPARRREPVKVYPDGREVLDLNTAEGKRIYAIRRDEMGARQENMCAICRLWHCNLFFDHQGGRGADAKHRDDRILVDGEWHNAALCWDCNTAKGSKRYYWEDGKYVPRT